MRKVTAGLFHSIDGVVEAPDQWQFDAFDEELGGIMMTTLAATDTVILGRKGYEDWAAYWPNTEYDDDFKTFITNTAKYVASRTLKGKLAWQNSTLIEGDLNAFARDLKNKPGGEIAVMGGIDIVRHLFLAGIVDELSLVTHPVIAGTGRRHLFRPDDPVTRVELVNLVRTSKGNAVSTYKLRA
ncbi:MAG: dihydrofolate reductase [Hyphomicrobiales bacterium]|nr:MAG: dihydrofolate reductase [Hyphomicrobiales bacterium]